MRILWQDGEFRRRVRTLDKERRRRNRKDSRIREKAILASSLMVRKRKSIEGEKHHNSKLTNEEARNIRALYGTGDFEQKELAEKFKVSRSCIMHIVLRHTYSHI